MKLVPCRARYASASESHRAWLEILVLEDRIAPVVGAGFIPPSMIPGDGNFEAYTGVVQVSNAEGAGSGSLIQAADLQGFGSYILTAAHVPSAGKQSTVRFDLPPRDAINPNPVTITLTVPAGPSFQLIDSEYSTKGADADLAILKLVDQAPGFQNSDRLLVPPFGAKAYRPYTVSGYTATEVNQPYTVVGYGYVSEGTTPVNSLAPSLGSPGRA